MNKYINKIINLSQKAEEYDEVPVAAIIINNNKIISQAYNKKEKTKLVTNHAELIAIEKACKKLKTYHLDNFIMYVTLEPCKMCCGAIEQSHISKIIYILDNEKFGDLKNINKKIVIEKITSEECINMYKKILQNFFKSKRK